MDATHSTETEPLVFTSGGVSCVTPACCLCHQTTEVLVDPVGLEIWKAGRLAQRAFPTYTLRQLNLLETGTHEHCWARMVSVEEDDTTTLWQSYGFFPEAGGPE